MGKIKKTALLILFLLSFLLVGCVEKPTNGENGNNNNGNSNNNEVVLPDLANSTKAFKEEIIYVNVKQNGTVENIQSSNKIKNTTFNYYEDYGQFLSNGNLNITSNKGEILIKEDEEKALIPSLGEHNNFYYILTLNKDYYEKLLPFNVDINYVLNNKVVGYSELIGSSGILDMKITFTINEEAEEYFKTMFGAQIQIPFDSEKVEIIEAENALAKVVVAKTITLAYMAMPGQNLEIDLKLKVNDFAFEGLQATYQEFSLLDLIDNFINLKDLDFSQIDDFKDGVETVLEEFSTAKIQLDQLFNGLGLLTEESLSELLNRDNFSQLDELIESLNSSSFKQGYTLPSQAIKYIGLSNRDEYVENYNILQNAVNNDIKNLTNSYYNLTNLLNQIDNVINNLDTINNYKIEYQEFVNIIDNLIQLKSKLNNFEINLSIEDIIINKNELADSFNEIGTINNQIKESFQTLILAMSTLPFHISELSSLFDLFIELSEFVRYVSNLENSLSKLVNKIKIDQEDNVFSVIYQSGLEQFVEAILDGQGGNPALLDALALIVAEMGELNELDDLDQLKTLIKKDEVTQFRPIDEVLQGFIEMNKALTVVQEDQAMSFYDGLTLISLMGEILKQIPDNVLANNCEKVSFTSKFNLPPTFIQFVIKQQPF